MSEFFYLIPVSLAMGAAGLGIFLWSMRSKQYEDLDGAAARILISSDRPVDVTGTRTEPISGSSIKRKSDLSNAK